MGTPAGEKNGKNGFSHLREEVGGDPEQRELQLAVGEPLLASTTASPFLTLIFIPHFDILTFTTYQSFPIESKTSQPMGSWMGGAGESTAQAQPSLAGGEVLAGGKVLGGGKVGIVASGKVGKWQVQVEIRCYYGVDIRWRHKNRLGNMKRLNESNL